MKQHILFIHGAGEDTHAYDQKMVDSLRDALTDQYEIIYPPMPADHAYSAWRDHLVNELSKLDDGVIAVGHSFGASIWLKYLSEETPARKIIGIMTVATPYWGAEDWVVEDYQLQEGFATRLPDVPIYIYHCRDDEEVPFTHAEIYAEHIPTAKLRAVHTGGHQMNDDLRLVAEDILTLQ